MITQYTKLYIDSVGNVKHCATQLLPFPDGFEPIKDSENSTCIDIELDADFEDVGFDQSMVTASEILNFIEVVGGEPQAKPGSSKIMGNPRKKPVNESAIKAEIEQEISAMDFDKNQLIDEFKKKGRQIDKLSDLPTHQLIRLKKSLTKKRGR